MTGSYQVASNLLLWQSTSTFTAPAKHSVWAPVTEILTDGSFFVASAFHGPDYPPGSNNGAGIRMWHLSSLLEVIGVPVDLGPFLEAGINGGSECYPVGMAVGKNRVLMVSTGAFFSNDHFNANQYSWIIDCSGTSPVVQTTHMFYNNGTQVGQYDSMENSCFYDAATERAFIGSYGRAAATAEVVAVEVFNATTGQRLASGKGDKGGRWYGGSGCIGLYMNPLDSTKIVAIDPYVTTGTSSGYTVEFSFTVPLDGSSVTCTGSQVLPRELGGWQFAAGSPYISGGPGVIADDATSKNVNYYGPDGTILFSSPHTIYYTGDNLSTDNGRNLIGWFEDGGPGWKDPYGVLFIVDQTSRTMEELNLPFFGSPGGPQSADNPQQTLSADSGGNTLLLGANVQTFDYKTYSLLLWVVSRGPNLAGQLLDDRVRFHGK